MKAQESIWDILCNAVVTSLIYKKGLWTGRLDLKWEMRASPLPS